MNILVRNFHIKCELQPKQLTKGTRVFSTIIRGACQCVCKRERDPTNKKKSLHVPESLTLGIIKPTLVITSGYGVRNKLDCCLISWGVWFKGYNKVTS